jgi:hypothetical protein
MAIGQAAPMGRNPDGNMGTERGIKGQVITERDTQPDTWVLRSNVGAGCGALAKARDIGRSHMATHSQLWTIRLRQQEAMRRKPKDPAHKDLPHNG